MKEQGTPYLLILTGLMALFLTSCKDEVVQASSDVVFPPSNVSYSQYVQPLFNQACALVGCHDSESTASQLHLTGYSDLLLVPGVVVPGKPELSILVFRIEGTVGPQMPPNSPPLNQNQIDGIRIWIAEGAENN